MNEIETSLKGSPTLGCAVGGGGLGIYNVMGVKQKKLSNPAADTNRRAHS